MVNAGAAYTGAGIGLVVASPAIAAIPSGFAYANGAARALFGRAGGYVLGSWPTYTRLATAYGYGAYNVGNRLYSLFQRLQVELASNQGYLDMQRLLDRQGYIWEQESTEIPVYRTLWWELQYLGGKGIDLIRIPAPSITWPNVSR